MTQAQAISDIANNQGYLYVSDPSGTVLQSYIPNNDMGYAQIRQLGILSAPLAAGTRAYATITITAVGGPGLNLNVLTINGVSQIAGAVGMTNGNPTASAASIASAINSYVPGAGADYSAQSIGGTVYIYCNTPGTAVNGHVVVATFDVGVTATNTNVGGGIAANQIVDGRIGLRFWIDTAAVFASPTLVGATEITNYIIVRGMQSGAIINDVNSVSAGKINLTRQAQFQHVRVQSGGALVTVREIVGDGFQEGDTLFLTGYNAGNGITVTDYSSGTDNIYLSNSANYDSNSSDEVVVLRYMNDPTTGWAWYEMTRTQPLPPTVAQMRANNIPINPAGVKTFTLASPNQPAAIVTFDPGTEGRCARLTASGAVTLTGNYQITFTGTPIEGDMAVISGNSLAVTLGGFTLTISGATVPTYMALSGEWVAYCFYVSGVWVVNLVPDLGVTNTWLTNPMIVANAINLGQKGVPASLTAALFAANIIPAGSYQAGSIVNADIAAGTIDITRLTTTLQSAIGSTYTATITIPSADVLKLNSVPYNLIPAQGAGTFIVPIDITSYVDFNTTAYTMAGANVSVYVNTAANPWLVDTGFLGLTAGADTWRQPERSYNTNFTASNQGLYLTAATGNPTLGNSDLVVVVTYKVVTP